MGRERSHPSALTTSTGRVPTGHSFGHCFDNHSGNYNKDDHDHDHDRTNFNNFDDFGAEPDDLATSGSDLPSDLDLEREPQEHQGR